MNQEKIAGRRAGKAVAQAREIATFLRERLEYHYARGEFDDGTLCATMYAAPAWPRASGIRPRVLATDKAGKTYAVTCGQARKLLENLGETSPPKEMK